MMSMMSCQSAGVNKTGSEYMPDMAHSVAYEANTYGFYSFNRYGNEDDLHNAVQPRLPVNGTIARGYAGTLDHTGAHSHQGIAYKENGSVPYYYANNEEDRAKAMAEIINNPYPITTKALEKGKLLYNIQCGICHGEKGDGAGYLVRDDGGKYPVQPANFLLDEFITASNGRYYHALIHGRNLMGGYSDKLSYEERWDVIHYIRSLQAGKKSLEYNEKVNTLNSIEIPNAIVMAKKAAQAPIADSKIVGDTMMVKEVGGKVIQH